MPHNHTPMIELTLTVRTQDESAAIRLAEKLATIGLGLCAEPGVQVSADFERWPVQCHEHDQDGVQP